MISVVPACFFIAVISDGLLPAVAPTAARGFQSIHPAGIHSFSRNSGLSCIWAAAPALCQHLFRPVGVFRNLDTDIPVETRE